jgi:pentachlorophenol monooxygenase
MTDTDVLVAGAGPVGLTAAVELRRRGVDCLIVDRLGERAPYAKAVGVQPRTLEIWDSIGMAGDALDAATPMRGQLLYVNGEQVAEIVLELPPEVPFRFVALPQYETERLLTEKLERYGTSIERSVELTSFTQDADGVTAQLTGPDGPRTVRCDYLIGCDGAHSVVRKGLDLDFGGDAFPEEYMLGDVEVDWSMPPGFGIRAMHQTDGRTDDLLVCIPLPGHNRYRMSMLVPPDLAAAAPSGGEVAHGLESGSPPQLSHIQAALDRLAPQPTVASRLRWSSVFRISHRIVDRYGGGRAFVAGDAAHIHPPTGAQGMNTGIQDAHNLAWKLALTVQGTAAPGLLDSYDTERRPIGEEVVGRTVRHAREGIDAGPDDPSTLLLREAQLLVGYPDSPLVGEDTSGSSWPAGPQPGGRAPDSRGLRRSSVGFPIRLHDLLRSGEHTLLLYADRADQVPELVAVAAAAADRVPGRMRSYLVVGPGIDDTDRPTVTVHDDAGEFQDAYAAEGGCGYLIRPDGYVSYRARSISSSILLPHLSRTFA